MVALARSWAKLCFNKARQTTMFQEAKESQVTFGSPLVYAHKPPGRSRRFMLHIRKTLSQTPNLLPSAVTPNQPPAYPKDSEKGLF